MKKQSPKTKLYQAWKDMIRRCTDSTRHNYHRYGGRGIKVCEQWENSFYRFWEWSLKNKFNLGLSIDRINSNDLQGSKMLINFCDSSFAIGESAKDKSLRYLKQIKARNTEIKYDSENVAVYEISKNINFLAFTFVHTSCEREHLKEYTKEDRDTNKQLVIDMNNKGRSQRDIAKELGIALGTVNKYIQCSRS